LAGRWTVEWIVHRPESGAYWERSINHCDTMDVPSFFSVADNVRR